VPVGVGALKAALADFEPDVVLLHDPFWAPLGVTRTAHELGARVVAVHHGSVDLGAAGVPLPATVVRPLLRAWFCHAYQDADAVMSAVPTRRDTGRRATIPLRFGLAEPFRPRPEVPRGDEVLYVGRLAREKGVFELLEAAARSSEPWPLRFVGSGPLREQLGERARRLGIASRVSFAPYISDCDELSRTYAAACAVVMPGAYETFGLVAFEAASSGARVVVCDSAPSRRCIGPLAHTYRCGDVAGLTRAIEAARAAPVDLGAARALHERSTWAAVLRDEHSALAKLVG
jgi:alpha-1,6-mannosyltransferase